MAAASLAVSLRIAFMASVATPGQRVKSLEEEGEETDWRCRTCKYRFAGKRRLVKKLEVLPRASASLYLVNIIKLAFLKALTKVALEK